MPGFNHKGPNNQGPMTGRGMGMCRPSNQNAPNQTNPESTPTQGMGRGLGRGMGRGRKNRFGNGFGQNNSSL